MDNKDLVPVLKAKLIGSGDIGVSHTEPVEKLTADELLFQESRAIVPPYSPEFLCRLHEHSSALRQNIDSYVVNIDGNGHHFVPVIDMDDDNVFDKVRDSIYLEDLLTGESEELEDVTNFDMPTDDEVRARIDQIKLEMGIEKARLEAFFRFCCLDESFVSMRKRTRQDKEVMGNAFWEVIRNDKGIVTQFTYVPGFTVRMLPICDDLVKTSVNVKKTPLSYDTVEIYRKFRKFVQVFERFMVYFKEFGDPRVMSSSTGDFYDSVEDMRLKEGSDKEGNDVDVFPATEIIHFNIHSPISPYGMPRWIGTLLAVIGTRQAEEVNFLYFDNKSVPPLAVLVNGGRLSSDSTKALEDYVENKIKGIHNFHKILVIEGVPTHAQPLDSMNSKTKLEIVPLTMAQHNDALFQNYDIRNFDKVGMAFRLPRLLRGDIKDFNRATAEAALEFTEMQVFSPEREDFDWFINRKILSEFKVKYWNFVSNGPTTKNPIDLSNIIALLVREGILVPDEARELVQGIFNKDFKKIDEIWTKIPPKLLLGGILPDYVEEVEEDEVEEGDTKEEEEEVEEGEVKEKRLRNKKSSKIRDLKHLAKDLNDLRVLLNMIEKEESRRSFNEAKSEYPYGPIERDVIEVPEEELSRFFEK
jgi:PBSX family phage portal protein